MLVSAWLPTARTQPPPAEDKVPFSVLKDWYEARVEKPVVAVLTDEAAYTKMFNESFADSQSPKPVAEKVDFKSKQVVAICWGARNSTFYSISVASVTGTAKETTITVKTTVPKGIADPAITYPAVVVVIPKTENVRVVVTGDRPPAGFSDFTDLKKGMEVKVVSVAISLPAANPVKPDKTVRLPREIERPNRAWDYDGKRILGFVGQKILLWDAETGKLLRKMEGHKEHIYAVRFSPDGAYALSSSWMSPGGIMYQSKDTRTILWNLASGDMKTELKDQVAGEFSPDGKRILTFAARPKDLVSFDAAVWDLIGRPLATATLDKYSGPKWDALHFLPDGRSFAYVKMGAFRARSYSGVVHYDAEDGHEVWRSGWKDYVGYRLTSTGALASFGRENATLTDIKSGKEISSVPHGCKSCWRAVWTHDGRRVVALRGEKEIRILDLASGKITTGDKCGPYTFGRAVVSPDDRQFAIEWGGANGVEPGMGLYEMGTGKEIARNKLAQWGHMIGFSPDSKTLLVGGSEFVIYDAENGKKVRSLKLLDDVSFEHDWNQ
jgi:WD40 repeat protein